MDVVLAEKYGFCAGVRSALLLSKKFSTKGRMLLRQLLPAKMP